METVGAHPPGTPCWVVIVTPDAVATASFYSGLFGWVVPDAPGGYRLSTLRGRDVAGILELPESARQEGVAARWLVYVATDDIGPALDRVRPAGGTVLAPAFDVPGAGRMAVVADPAGAQVGLWEADGHAGAGVLGEPGSFAWSELYTRSRAAAARFYGPLFGWDVEEVRAGAERYLTCSVGGRAVAGMMQMSAAWGDTPSHWVAYFAVGDVDATVARASELGAEVATEPHDAPAGRLAVLRDPQGAHFYVVAPG